MPTGLHEVRVWWDPVLENWIVGKRVDLSEIQDDADLIEPRIMEMLKHPNIVDVRAVANVPGFPAPMRVVEVLMPYFERGSITDALESGETFTPTQALQITQAALQGLSEMHERHRILHRDIKSPNLFLTGDSDFIKIGDLGVAGAMDDTGKAPCVPVAHPWAPPELMIGPGVTRSSDLYSLGAVLLELLSGKLDYASYTTTEVVDALQKGRRPLRENDRQLPVWVCRRLRKLIFKAIQADPDQRFSSAREMSAALATVKIADWTEIEPNVWQAPHRHLHECWKVTATSTRAGSVELVTFRRKSASWRRTGESLVVPSIQHPKTLRYFEDVNKRAVN